MARSSPVRTAMLRSASTLFSQRGIAATTLADVVAHARAPRGSIYHHFPGGKPQLVIEAIRFAGAEMASMISAGLTQVGPVDTVAAIMALFRGQLVANDFVAGCPIAPSAFDIHDIPEAMAAAGETFSTWEDAIAAALWQRGVPRERAQQLATLSISAFEGALVMARAQRTTTALDRVGAELSDLLGDAVGENSP